MKPNLIRRFGERVGYDETELESFRAGGHRTRHVNRLVGASSLYSIQAEVVRSLHCNSGHVKRQKLLMDIDGNIITRQCPKRMCIYLVSQLAIAVALINERLSEGHDPQDFHFMRQVRCLDAGVECLGYGEVMVRVHVVAREKSHVN